MVEEAGAVKSGSIQIVQRKELCQLIRRSARSAFSQGNRQPIDRRSNDLRREPRAEQRTLADDAHENIGWDFELLGSDEHDAMPRFNQHHLISR